MAGEYVLDTVTGRARLKPRPGPYYVRIVKGLFLGLRVAKKGATWCGRFQPKNGEPQFITFEPLEKMTHEQARRQLETWGESLRHGRPAMRADRTIADICYLYFDALNKRPERKADQAKPGEQAERLLRMHLLGRVETKTVHTMRNGAKRTRTNAAARVHPLAMRVACEVIETEFEEWREGLVSSRGGSLAPGSVDRVIGILGAALNWAKQKRLIDASRAIEWRYSLEQTGGGSRVIALEGEDIRAMLKACPSQAFRDLCELAVLTGARLSELRFATVRDFQRGKLRVNGKTGERTFTVNDAAHALLTRLCKSKTPGAYLVPDESGQVWQPGDVVYRMRKTRDAAELPEGTCFYTLRHTFITQALSGSDALPPLVVADITGTSLKMIDEHYGHEIEAHADPIRRKRIAS